MQEPADSGKINHGSKAILMGTGDAKRDLVREFSGQPPAGVQNAEPYCGGCLVVEGSKYESEPDLAGRLAECGAFDDWQVVIIHDDSSFARTTDKFLWATWTRFNPATDIYAKNVELRNNHIGYTAPIVIDARMKPWFPNEVEVREDIARLVDQRWREYFPL